VEGGSANAYDYGFCDPVNGYDLDGAQKIRCGEVEKAYLENEGDGKIKVVFAAKFDIDGLSYRFDYWLAGTRMRYRHYRHQGLLEHKVLFGLIALPGSKKYDLDEEREVGGNQSVNGGWTLNVLLPDDSICHGTGAFAPIWVTD